MIYIGKYREFNPGLDYPSIRDFFSDDPYPEKYRIAAYLRNGNDSLLAGGSNRDVITGEAIPLASIFRNDGVYSWHQSLAYYVEKYNLILPEDFMNHILSKDLCEYIKEHRYGKHPTASNKP